MSFAAEPYGTFVEDLLANLTGAESRMRFTYVDDELPFRIPEHERPLVTSVRAHGISGGTFREFVRKRDFEVALDGTVVWAGDTTEFNPPDHVLPDAGTEVWIGFERQPGGPPPLLNDRNPGSVVRTLAEAFALEFAVLSHQLELVYDAAFVDTAGGQDLDQVAALVGVVRRGATHAVGEVVLRRLSPAPADITVPAGTLISTVGAPNVTVETTTTVSMRRGAFSATAPVRSTAPGPDGVTGARTLTLLNRPLFGVEEVLNLEPLSFGGGSEPDGELRDRIRRALEVSGRATPGAIRGALGGLHQIREQDVLVEEDHLGSPGLVTVTVAAEITDTANVLASRTLEEMRPAGVRIVHNLLSHTTPLPILAEDTGGGGNGPVSEEQREPTPGAFVPVTARLVVTPADLELTEDRRTALADAAAQALIGAVAELGPGDPVVYNRLVARVMAVEGLLDAVLDLGFVPPPGGTPDLRRFNLPPVGGKRPALAKADLTLEVRGDRVMLDVTAVVERTELTAGQERGAALAAIGSDLEDRLTEYFRVTPDVLSQADLLGALPATDLYAVDEVKYRVELVDEGLRVSRDNVVLDLDAGQIVWLRSVKVSEAEGILS